MNDSANAPNDSTVMVPEAAGTASVETAETSSSAAPRPGSLANLWRVLRPTQRHLNLALQGGGAHGAFTWGVLDALLEDPAIRFEGLSGSSAGAMNAVVMADGWMKGGAEGARRGLALPFTHNLLDRA